MSQERHFEFHIPIIGNVRVNFFGIGSNVVDLYEENDEFQRQQRINHLGLVSHVLNGTSHSRFEYLILQCVLSELAENSFKGTASAQGNIKINSTSYTGNSIIKAWILLSNFGHTINTIGDEKAILLHCAESKKFKRSLLDSIKDNQLRDWAKEVISNLDYVNFHHVLSIRRIYKTLKNRTKKQKELLDIYKLLLLKSKELALKVDILKAEQLKSIYKNIRALAIIALDSRNSHLPITVDLLSSVLSYDFYENKYQQTGISSILSPFMVLLYDEVYLNCKVQTIQRGYEVLSLKSMKEKPIDEIINLAFTDGIVSPSQCNLQHFARYELTATNQSNTNLLEEFRSVSIVKKGCNGVEASLDLNPITHRKVVDFYIEKDTFNYEDMPKFIFNVCSLIENLIKSHDRNSLLEAQKQFLAGGDQLGITAESINSILFSSTIWRKLINESIISKEHINSYRSLLWSIIRFYIDDKYYFDIDYHIKPEYEIFGIKLHQGKQDLLTENITKAIAIEEDKDRIHELAQLLSSVRRNFDGYILACLARITIYDYSKSPDKRKVTDIDSVVLKVNENQFILEFHESKNTKRACTEAVKDLREKFIKVLDKKRAKYKIVSLQKKGAKLVIQHNRTMNKVPTQEIVSVM